MPSCEANRNPFVLVSQITPTPSGSKDRSQPFQPGWDIDQNRLLVVISGRMIDPWEATVWCGNSLVWQ